MDNILYFSIYYLRIISLPRLWPCPFLTAVFAEVSKSGNHEVLTVVQFLRSHRRSMSTIDGGSVLSLWLCRGDEPEYPNAVVHGDTATHSTARL